MQKSGNYNAQRQTRVDNAAPKTKMEKLCRLQTPQPWQTAVHKLVIYLILAKMHRKW